MWEVVEKRNIISSWFLWHYIVALKLLYKRWIDFMRFNLDYFSIPFLLKTLFSPWRKYKISYGRGFDFNRYAEALFFNTFSRFMGFFLRVFVILAGVVMQALVSLGGIVIIVVWLLLPVITLMGIILSFR